MDPLLSVKELVSGYRQLRVLQGVSMDVLPQPVVGRDYSCITLPAKNPLPNKTETLSPLGEREG